MGFTRLSSELSAKSRTELDNIFILEFMPFAPENYCKVYIYGKMLADGNSNADNSAERMAKLLGITEDEVMDAFKYWETQGLVRISAVPPYEVEFTPVRYSRPSHKTFSKKKYAAFNEMLLRMFEGKRDFLPSELNEYYSAIEDFHIEPEAMLAIISYCKRLKGTSIGWKYIITVARNLANEGCHTTTDVENKLAAFDIISDDIAKLFKTLKIKRTHDFEDVRLYRKWTEEMGFKPGTVLSIAQNVYGEMKGLDTILTRYHADGLIELEDIEEYRKNRDNLLALTKEILVRLDVRYNHLDYYAETYIKEWLKLGFNDEALRIIADYCFKHGKTSCEKMKELVNDCAASGLISADDIRSKFSAEGKYDKAITELLRTAGVTGDVTSRDRDSYNIWINYWKVQPEMLQLAAKMSLGEANPRVKMHLLIKSWNEKGITTPEAAKAANAAQPAAYNNITSDTTAKLNEKISKISAEDI